MIGSVINYSLSKGVIRVRFLLDANKKRLTVFTQSNPIAGEIFTDLPKDGLFYPAIQNKTRINAPSALKVTFKFELVIPQDRSTIYRSLSSNFGGEGDDEESLEERSQNSTLLEKINESSMMWESTAGGVDT
jgi:hypothetical protein